MPRSPEVPVDVRAGAAADGDLTPEAVESIYADSLERAAREARALVKVRAGICAGAAAAALPGFDFLVDAASLASLFAEINRRFQLAPEDIAALHQEQRMALYKILSEIGAQFAGKTITSAVVIAGIKQLGVRWFAGKAAGWVPIAGRGAAAGISFWAVKALGEAHIRECLAVRRRMRSPWMLAE